MVNLNKSKKALDLNVEVTTYVLAIVVIGLLLFVAGSGISKGGNQAEKMAPNLSYQYPAVFVKSFLLLEVEDYQKENLNLDENKNYYVQDLIYIGGDDVKDVVTQMKKDFIADMETSNSLKSFNDFSKSNFNNKDLLYIEYDESKVPDLEKVIMDNNYVFYFKGADKKFRYVYFKGGNY